MNEVWIATKAFLTENIHQAHAQAWEFPGPSIALCVLCVGVYFLRRRPTR